MRGKVVVSIMMIIRRWDHPRVCGEKMKISRTFRLDEGSPPRMRGKVRVCIKKCIEAGITPAYAGKRKTALQKKRRRRDHPRVCGEKVVVAAAGVMVTLPQPGQTLVLGTTSLVRLWS